MVTLVTDQSDGADAIMENFLSRCYNKPELRAGALVVLQPQQAGVVRGEIGAGLERIGAEKRKFLLINRKIFCFLCLHQPVPLKMPHNNNNTVCQSYMNVKFFLSF